MCMWWLNHTQDVGCTLTLKSPTAVAECSTLSLTAKSSPWEFILLKWLLGMSKSSVYFLCYSLFPVSKWEHSFKAVCIGFGLNKWISKRVPSEWWQNYCPVCGRLVFGALETMCTKLQWQFWSHLFSLPLCNLPYRGDQTSAEAFLNVLPKEMECVVFSIDGSFAASVSIMGSDPKMRAGAVDVVRWVIHVGMK